MEEQIWLRFGQAKADLFAIQENSHCTFWFSLFHPVPLGLVAMTQEGSEGLLCVFPQLLSCREFWRGSGSTGAAVARSPVLADPSVVFEPGLPPRRLPISGADLEGSVVSGKGHCVLPLPRVFGSGL